MATSSAISGDAPEVQELEKQLADLEGLTTEEDLDKKLASISRFSYLTKWMKYIFNKDTEEEFKAEWLTIDEYKQLAEESLENAWRVINLPNWRVEKRGSVRGDVVESTHAERFGKVYRFTGVVECPPNFLHEEFKNNLARLPEWNPTILKSEIIKEISDGIDLSYQVTAGGGKGIIAPRDFVILRRAAALSRDGTVTGAEPYCYISSGVSVSVPGYPPMRDMVRGHNKVGCWVIKPKTVQLQGGKIEQHSVFQWLMCCDLKGRIPQFVLDAAFATVMLDYIVHVRKFAAESKTKGMF